MCYKGPLNQKDVYNMLFPIEISNPKKIAETAPVTRKTKKLKNSFTSELTISIAWCFYNNTAGRDRLQQHPVASSSLCSRMCLHLLHRFFYAWLKLLCDSSGAQLRYTTSRWKRPEGFKRVGDDSINKPIVLCLLGTHEEIPVCVLNYLLIWLACVVS